MKDFGTNLKELRMKNNLSQNQLADILCVERATVGKWERGLNYPNQNIMLMICDYFDVSLDFLFGRTSTHALFDDARIPKTEIQQLYDNLTPAQQQNLLNYARGMVVSNSLEKYTNSKNNKMA